jgi:hypothetical protein
MMRKLNKYMVSQTLIQTWFVEAFDEEDAVFQAQLRGSYPDNIDAQALPVIELTEEN